jgi:hypothetical protein
MLLIIYSEYECSCRITSGKSEGGSGNGSNCGGSWFARLLNVFGEKRVVCWSMERENAPSGDLFGEFCAFVQVGEIGRGEMGGEKGVLVVVWVRSRDVGRFAVEVI